MSKINIEGLWNNLNSTILYDENCYEFMLRDTKFIGSMKKTSIGIHVFKDTEIIEFVKDSKKATNWTFL